MDVPLVALSDIAAAGGPMTYWYTKEAQLPTVALMAMDFISAPGECGTVTSEPLGPRLTHIAAILVSAEQQFSAGRRAIDFTQHQMSQDTFRARTALGSWEGTPLFPDWLKPDAL
jgi:hypothetical protein